MRRIALALLITLAAAPSFAADAPKTDEQKTLYAVGQVIARQLAVFNLTPQEFDLVKQGLSDAMAGKPAVADADAYSKQIQELAQTRRKVEGEKLAAKAKEFLENAAKEKGAVKTSSGMVFRSIQDGTGDSPKASDKVKVNYRGTLIDGKEFDSSYKRGKPIEFPLSGVIKCWTEGVQLMKTGGKAQLVCPADLAYGKTGAGMIPPDAALVFEVELLDIVKTPTAPTPVPAKPAPAK